MNLAKIVSNIRKPWVYVNYLNGTSLRVILPDRLAIACRYRDAFDKKLNLKAPQTFNEKLQWLKLHDRNPHYSLLVDKYEVKNIVAQIIGKEHVIPTYGVWDDPEEIDFDALPDEFVLKTTHDSHTIVICPEKKKLDLDNAKALLRAALRNRYFYGGREWPYKNVRPRIMAEKYMSNNATGLTDYKIHCFHGEPGFILACRNRYTEIGLQEVFYDLQWEKMPVSRPGSHPEKTDIEKPERLEEMLRFARMLSRDIPFVRVDLYECKGVVYFGEMTFFPASGYKRFVPDEYDNEFGSLIILNRGAAS